LFYYLAFLIMQKLFKRLMNDVRFQEGLTACINCGTCTAICPAASFYNYQPRNIVMIAQNRDDAQIEALLKSDTIWYCGECMSCKTRCPRGNAPGLIIMAMRALSQDMGWFTASEKGRQQLAVKRMIADTILETGYCVYAEHINTDRFPEAGPVWDWERENLPEVMDRLGANYKNEGPGILRKIPQESLDEVRRIFEVTGGMAFIENIENCSQTAADEAGMSNLPENDEYFEHVFTASEKKHQK